MRRSVHPLLQKLAALVLLGVGLGLGGTTIVMPLAEAMAAHEGARQRVARFEQMLQQADESEPTYDAAELAATHADGAEAQIALQTTIDRIARGAGVAVQSVRPLAAEQMSEIGRGVWVEMNLTCDLQGLVDLLTDLNTERPVLLVRRLDIARGEGARPDSFLRVQLEVGRAWRQTEGAQ